jgi:hypothetical protein
VNLNKVKSEVYIKLVLLITKLRHFVLKVFKELVSLSLVKYLTVDPEYIFGLPDCSSLSETLFYVMRPCAVFRITW